MRLCPCRHRTAAHIERLISVPTRCRYGYGPRGDAPCEDRAVTTVDRARAGDEQAFADLVAPFRRELQVHCYRILGSLQDAEDVLQETLLAAWRASNASRSGVAALLALPDRHQPLPQRTAGRRPAAPAHAGAAGPPNAPEPTGLRAVARALSRGAAGGLPDRADGPGRRYETKERSRWRSSPVYSGYHRGRRHAGAPRRARVPRGRGGGHARHHRGRGQQRPAAGPRRGRAVGRTRDRATLPHSAASGAARPVRRGFESGDLERWLRCSPTTRGCACRPPARVPRPRGDRRVPGHPPVVGGRARRPARAHQGQRPAGIRLLPRDPHAAVVRIGGLLVLTLDNDAITAVTRFGDTGVLTRFGLPRTLRL